MPTISAEMAEVINNFSVGEIYMPKVTHTSRTYETLLQTIRDKQLKIHNGTAGTVIVTGKNAGAEFYPRQTRPCQMI